MSPFKLLVPVLGAAAMATAVAQGGSSSPAEATTVILVHGAFADSASWNGVVPRLQGKGLRVVSVANPLRTLMPFTLAS
jgi:pimeloyl-ACP methyl ester carboxylesterase